MSECGNENCKCENCTCDPCECTIDNQCSCDEDLEKLFEHQQIHLDEEKK